MEKQPKRDEGKKNIHSEQARYGGLRQMVKAASLFFGLGFFLAANVGVCIWLGWKFDGYFGTAPAGILTGIFLGFPVAILSLWKKMSEKR
ncbi:MAG: AtpZ/AtpI family protein [Schwartzia sp. (in: firmicutes)]